MFARLLSSAFALMLITWAIIDTDSLVAVAEVAIAAFVQLVRLIAQVAESQLTS